MERCAGVSKAGSYATRILSITDIMQISIPTARVTTPCRRLHDVVAGTVVFLPFLETPSRAFPRPLFLVSCSLHHPPGHAYSSCHLPSESENELFTYLRYVNGISVVPRCPSKVEEELRWRGWPSQPRKLAQEGDNRWTWSVLERERERELWRIVESESDKLLMKIPFYCLTE